MREILLKICLIGFLFLAGGFSHTYAFSGHFLVQNPVTTTQLVHTKKIVSVFSCNKCIVTLGILFSEPAIQATTFEAIEEVIEEDDDAEYSSHKKLITTTSSVYLAQSINNPFNTNIPSTAKSWLQSSFSLFSTTNSKLILYCNFRI